MDGSAITPSEAARLLGMSKTHLLRLTEQGKLTAERTPLGRIYDRDVVLAFAEIRKP